MRFYAATTYVDDDCNDPPRLCVSTLRSREASIYVSLFCSVAGLLFLLEQFFCRRYLELRVVPYARRVTSAEGDAGTFSAPRPACRHRRRRRRVPHSDAAESGAPQREEKKLLFSGQQQLPAPPAAGGIESDHPPARAAPSHTVGFEGDDASAGANGNRPTEATPWPGRDFRLNKVLPGSVYLWACGERSDGDGTSPVSRPEHWAAWVVLVVSARGDFFIQWLLLLLL